MKKQKSAPLRIGDNVFLIRETAGSLVNKPKHFDYLSRERQEILVDWCFRLRKIDSINYRSSSYGLKHFFKEFYITNGQLKGAMLKAGFKKENADPEGMNWHFNVSKKSVNEISKQKNI